MEKFLIITPMGLEESVLKEIALKHPNFYGQTTFNTSKGLGQIEFSAPLGALTLNKSLLTPTRILLRLKDQKCRDLPKLYNILRKFNWRPYLKTQNIEFKISTKKSRLINTQKMQISAQKAISDYQQANALSQKILDQNKDNTQTIYIRVEDDNLTLSLDTSGELLHKRGESTFRGKASIRENIASCLLMELFENLQWENQILVDPMCGSATFLREALKFSDSSTNRSYAYELFYNEDELERVIPKPPLKVFGMDNDELVAKSNYLEFVTVEDVFSKDKSKLCNPIIITNPPYGKRIKIQGKKSDYFLSLINQIQIKFSPILLGMIIPTDVDINQFKEVKGFEQIKNIKFFNSGIWVRFIVWKRSSTLD